MLRKTPFATHEKAAFGLAGLGVSTGISGAIISKAGEQNAAVKPLGGSLNTAAGFSGIATTAYMGQSLMGTTKRWGRYRR